MPKDSVERPEIPVSCRLLGKSSYDQQRSRQGLQNLNQNLPVEQKHRLHAEKTLEPQWQNQAALVHYDSARSEDKRVLMGVGVQGQSPYVSLNFQHILAKHGSFPASPYSLGHLTDGYGYRSEDISPYLYRSPSPASRPSPEGHSQIPHYIGTSVIISNER